MKNDLKKWQESAQCGGIGKAAGHGEVPSVENTETAAEHVERSGG